MYKKLEEQMTTLKKHFGAIVATVKDLKCSVEALEKKFDARGQDGIKGKVNSSLGCDETIEIRQIIESQKVIDEIIVANSDKIKRLEKEQNELSRK